MASSAALLLLRTLPLLRSPARRPPPFRRFAVGLSALDTSQSPRDAAPEVREPSPREPPWIPPSAPASNLWPDHPDYRKWKDKEDEILNDIQPITLLTKEILHSERYMDGERLCADDEKEVVEKLLGYHPHSEDKIGCGLDYIMVDRHPTFRHSRCLFVVRTDGGWIDFSYQKCLRAYVREKYPSYAERFIREHFKRT